MEQERQNKWNRKQGAGLVKGKGWVLEAALDWMPRGHGCRAVRGMQRVPSQRTASLSPS